MTNPHKNDTPDKALVERVKRYKNDNFGPSSPVGNELLSDVIAALSQPQHGGLVEAILPVLRIAYSCGYTDRPGERNWSDNVVRLTNDLRAALVSPVVGEDAYCNKCGFFGKPQEGGAHLRPRDGEMCNYAAITKPTPTDTADRYFITKGGAYYRPNAEGYTRDTAQAGRFTLEEAISHSHPSGPDGPRDGIRYELAPKIVTDTADRDYDDQPQDDDTFDAKSSDTTDRREAVEVERDIRIAIWNAAMKGGMGQDLSQAFINRAMDEPLMKRALASLIAGPPEGFVLVPVEPTEAMLCAWATSDKFKDDWRADCRAGWSAMIAAATGEA